MCRDVLADVVVAHAFPEALGVLLTSRVQTAEKFPKPRVTWCLEIGEAVQSAIGTSIELTLPARSCRRLLQKADIYQKSTFIRNKFTCQRN